MDDLQCDGLMLIQNPKYYTFTSDAVLLANYEKYRGRVCELCSGSGVISLLVSKKCNVKCIEALELQPCMADLARRNVEMNGMAGVIKVTEGDVRLATEIYGRECFDAVIVNPPYMKARSGEGNANSVRDVARHEIMLTFEDVAWVSANLLRYGGALYVVHRSDRLAELIYELKRNGLEPKKITYYPANRNTARVIIKAVKGGKSGVITDFSRVEY